jgi:hypothetical protein
MEIGDWYQQTRDEHGRLKLSSRRLLALAENSGLYSAYRVALTVSGWPEPVEVLAKIHDEIAGDNASKRAEPGETATFNGFTAPNDRLRLHLEALEEERDEEEAVETLYDDFGFS